MIEPDKEAVKRVGALFWDAPFDKKDHKDRNKRDGEHRTGNHRKSLRPCKRCKEQALLSTKRENRQKRDDDEQKCEEDRPTDHLRACGYDLDTFFVIGQLAVLLLIAVQQLVGIFYHDDAGIHHRPDRDRNAAKTHNVAADAKELHQQKGHPDSKRQCKEDDHRTSEVKKKEPDDNHDDQTLIDERSLECLDRFFDQRASIIYLDDIHTLHFE